MNENAFHCDIPRQTDSRIAVIREALKDYQQILLWYAPDKRREQADIALLALNMLERELLPEKK